MTQQTAIAARTRRARLGWPVLRSRRQRLAIGRVLLFGVVLAVWQFGAPLFHVPSFLLPTPTAIGAALVRGLLVSPLAPDGFYYHAAVTLAEGFAGCLLGGALGLFLGTALAYSPLLERVTLPYIMGFQSVPKVAVAPLIIIWFGIGMSSKIVLVTLLAFFPLLINSLLGFKSVEPERLELLASLRASRWQVFRLVMVRSALPAILAGVEMAILFGLTGSIVGEFLAGQAGLGVLIQRTKSSFNLAGTFAVLVTLALLGVLLVVVVRLMRRKLVFWAAADRRLDTNL